MFAENRLYDPAVHGGIRHLENDNNICNITTFVHGGIRHLEKALFLKLRKSIVHGGIRHLEIGVDSRQRYT